MKKIFLLYIITFSFNLIAQPQWIKINSPTTNVLKKIVFADSLNGWAAGLNGTIIHTSDGGETWVVQNTNTTNPIIDIHFINNQVGWALNWELNNPSFGTYIMRTTNGGVDWISEFFPIELEYFKSIFFLNEQFGLIGDRFTYYTTNSGIFWNLSQRDSDLVANFPFYQIKMLNEQLGFACGGVLDNAGVIWKTTDGGRNWKTNGISPDEIFEMFVFDSLHILALSGDPEYRYGVGLIKSSDGGETWSYEELPINAVCFGIDFRNNLEGWSAAGFKFLYTTDGGNTWNETQTPDSSIVFDLVFVNDKKGFACGQDGALLKYIPDPNFVDDETVNSDLDFQLFQNYPNPFNPTTKIRYSIPGNLKTRYSVSLQVYDILGNEVATLVDEFKEPGTYEIEFNLAQIALTGRAELASGIYFYRLQVGNSLNGSGQIFVKTRKMILLR
ncbi:MAG: YCF48-related protein [Ignavibacterium sp.]|uniref:YCF48-related protein n=1 Tax=Ignavibacterium sp. TaxID=2651167 RepID=UPI0040492ABC